MKIGLISSGNDTLALWKILTKFDHEYLLYHDQLHFPFGEKESNFIQEEIKKAVWFLREQWAEVVLVDPVYELALASKDVLPLFQTYLQEYAFKYSLVGKIWILTDFGSKEDVQALIEASAKNYQPTENQKKIKSFNFPFSYWVKSANARPAGIGDLGVHNPYLIRTLKNDLRYFKDANIDTLLPMHYQYFRMQRTIKAFFNFNKIRFHDLSVIEECFQRLTKGQESEYNVKIWTNQDPKFLMKEKELIWLLGRGKNVELKVERV